MSLEAVERALALADGVRNRLRAEKSSPGGALSASGSPYGTGSRQMSTAMEQERHLRGWVYANVSAIAKRVARQPVNVGQKVTGPAAKGRKTLAAPACLKMPDDRVKLRPGHPLAAALADPNPLMVQWVLLYLTVCYLQLTGVAYWWVEEERDGSLSLWPMPTSWVIPINDPRTPTPFDYYEIRPLNGSGVWRVLPDEMLRISLPDPQDPYQRSLSPLQALARSVNADEAIEISQTRTFQNGIFPGLGIKVGRHPDAPQGPNGTRPHMTKEQREQLITAIRQRYAGVMAAGEPLILDGLIEEVFPITTSPQEMAYLESAGLTQKKLDQGFGVNPIIKGEIEGANRASAVVAEEHFYATTVNPLIELISQNLTRFFGGFFRDPDLLTWVEEARARDVDAERADLEQQVKARAITVNELRAAYGRDPIQGGDVLINPATAAAEKGQGR